MELKIARNRRAHWRVIAAAVCGLVAGALSYKSDPATRALIGWNVGASVLLLGILHTMMTVKLGELKQIACKEDETASVVLFVLLGAIVASLVGVVVEIGAARSADVTRAALYTALGVTTLILSWLSMHVSFALHYAHRFYGDRDRDEKPDGGLSFPQIAAAKNAHPGYLEFVYLAFCIGMTCQVSDVVVQTHEFRRLVTAHAVLAFFYNMFILGLAVNLFSAVGAR